MINQDFKPDYLLPERRQQGRRKSDSDPKYLIWLTLGTAFVAVCAFMAGLHADPAKECVDRYRSERLSPQFTWTDSAVEASADDLLRCINK